MVIQKKDSIKKFTTLIKSSDFSKIPYHQLPDPGNQRIVEVLAMFFEDYLSGRSRKNPLVAMAIDYTSIPQEELPLLPLHKLKILGVVLSYIKDIDGKIYQIYQKKLSSYKTYSQDLFELQIGCILKNNDPEMVIFEINNPDFKYPPDFHRKLDNDINIWIDAFVRKRDKSFFDYFQRDHRGVPIPKSQEEIDLILKEFVKTTCTTISKKRKKSIAENDIFIAVVRISDRYSSGSIDYQSLVNSLSRNDIIVVFKGETGYYVGENLAKESIRIYLNGSNQFEEAEIDYINKIFS